MLLRKDATSARAVDLIFIILVGVLPQIVSSLLSFSATPTSQTTYTLSSDWNSVFWYVPPISAWAYVLYKQGKTLRDFKFSLHWSDLVVTLLLIVLSYIVMLGIVTLARTAITSAGNQVYAPVVRASPTLTMVVTAIINPFYEEVVLRVFLITQLRALLKVPALSILICLLLQFLYHTYQGIPNALAVTGFFLLLSLYYYKYGRVLPLILTHFYFDILPVIVAFNR